MSSWKNRIKLSKILGLALVVGLVFVLDFVMTAPALAGEIPQKSDQVLSKAVNNNVTSSTTIFNKLDPKDVDVTVTTGTDLSALKISNGNYVLTGNDFTIDGKQVKILSSYLNGLSTKSAKLKFNFDGGSDKNLTITLKNESAAISAKSVSFTNKSTKDVQVTVKANGLTLNGISYDGADLPKDAYSVGTPSSSGSIKVSLKASYLATLANDTTKKLVFIFSGTGTNPSIILKVSGCKVPTILSVRTVNLTTPPGVAPNLPKQVTANYTDTSSKLVDVTWDAIAPSAYAEAGTTFYVEGTIAGTTFKAHAIITVSAVTDPAVIAATELVVKAESSKTQADKDEALAAVNALPPSTAKTDLLARLSAIVVETDFVIVDVY
jgi:Bacterial Ig-like domain (group 4)./Domain of unknown function.